MHGGELLSIDHDGGVRSNSPQFKWLGHQHDLFHIHGNHARLPKFKMLQIATDIHQVKLSQQEKQEKRWGKLRLP
jgi:hypothetical protein